MSLCTCSSTSTHKTMSSPLALAILPNPRVMLRLVRIWWPRHHPCQDRLLFLVGWFHPSGNGACLDVLVTSTIHHHQAQQVLGCYHPPPYHQQLEQEHRPEAVQDVWLTLSSAAEKEGGPLKLHRLIFQGRVCRPEKHIVFLYAQPRLGSGHFGLGQAIGKLQEEEPDEMEILVKRLNCAAFVERSMVATRRQHFMTRIVMFAVLLYHMIGCACTCLLQPLRLGSLPALPNSLDALQARLQEFSIWPSLFLLAVQGPFHPDVAVCHRLRLTRHSLSSKLLVDLALGAALGGVLLVQETHITAAVVSASQSVTNGVLRTGCVWLMGAPAGFKLNSDLAKVIGTAALDVIQASSRVWSCLLPFSGLLCKALALLSVTFGATISVAFVADLLLLAEVHIALLQRVAAFVYGYHLRSLVALWRLFSGRKQNQLRQRVDSYDYTVDKLVVASLTFAPLLLLLPTSSIFYVFFSMIHATTHTPRLVCQTVRAILRWFPHAQAWIWFFGSSHNFPSGVYFHVTSTDMSVLSTLTSFGALMQPFASRMRAVITSPERFLVIPRHRRGLPVKVSARVSWQICMHNGLLEQQ